MEDIIIVGAGGFGRELLATINEINAYRPTWNVLGFIDGNVHALDGFDTGYDVLDVLEDWRPTGNEKYAMGIASPQKKEKLVPLLKSKGAEFASIISPTATIGERTILGEGVVMFGQAGISIDCKIGDYVFINAMGGIGHDCIIGDYCTFGPKVCISGATKIGRCANFGALASTFPGIEVGDYATVGMNSCAIRKVKANTTVIGVPAKSIV